MRFGVVVGSRKVFGGPQIAAGRVGLVGRGVIWARSPISGCGNLRRGGRLIRRGGCQSVRLRSGRGRPRAKRRFWD